MVKVVAKGEFKSTEAFLNKLKSKLHVDIESKLHKYGAKGVAALAAATPKRTGLTASSWTYSVIVSENLMSVRWSNTNFNKGVPIAIVIQYGHGTGWGGYVQGIDYINPAIKPIMTLIVDEVWKEVRPR